MQKTILITGAGSGIGKASALALARRGHKVIATTHTEEQAISLLTEIRNENLSTEAFKLDITESNDREKVLNYKIDVFINNAAIGQTGSLAEVPVDRIRKNFEVNVFSTIEITQLVLRNMLKQNNGTVLFVSSLAGRLPSAFLNPYSMTKFALSGGVAALRKEIKMISKNVHISLIEPGAYATGFNQKMLATKYQWMDKDSYFYKIIPTLQANETRNFELIEQKTTDSIVQKIVLTSESKNPKTRYVAPFYQGFFVRVMRLLGE
ncbi:MAG: SDR family NAD(P)-dependent oxidoreductase [bacterium]|nr:SDR family NAD(P)-dependent oxidoreductase [bacterium]